MLKCRVPIQAIKNKMMLDKVDPRLLDKHMGIETVIPTPPPPPINLNMLKKKNLLKSISKLKSNQNKNPNPKNGSTSNSFRVTLNDLKNIKLKKTSVKKEPVKFSHMNPFVNPEALTEMKNKILRK